MFPMSRNIAMLFQFADESAARLAADTLEELGYGPVALQDKAVHIHLRGDDITSALEIAQAHGGNLEMKEELEGDGWAMAEQAYGMDGIPIPAHIVNEDWVYREERGAIRPGDPDGAAGHDFPAAAAVTSREAVEQEREEAAIADDLSYGYFPGDIDARD